MSDEILRRAIDKTRRSEPLSRDERRAFDRAKREKAEKDLRDGLASLPKKLYVELSGRQHKVLDEQASRYGLPLLGKSIDVGQVLRRFHDLLRDHGDALSGETPAPEQLEDWGEEFKKWKALTAKAEFQEHCQQLLRRHVVDEVLQRVAGLLRGCGERLQHEGHAEAYAMLDETLADAEREIAELLGGQAPLQDAIEQG